MKYIILQKEANYNQSSLIYYETPFFNDQRGGFGVSLDPDFKNQITNKTFIQSNYSFNHKNVIRGMHYQIINPQAKLVRCISGKIIDIVLDIRLSSPTFGKIYTFELNKPNIFLYVPEGFAHGFITLENNSIFEYFVSDIWNKNGERSISIKNILKIKNLFKKDYILSEKDKNPTYQDTNNLFLHSELKQNQSFL